MRAERQNATNRKFRISDILLIHIHLACLLHEFDVGALRPHRKLLRRFKHNKFSNAKPDGIYEKWLFDGALAQHNVAETQMGKDRNLIVVKIAEMKHKQI